MIARFFRWVFSAFRRHKPAPVVDIVQIFIDEHAKNVRELLLRGKSGAGK